jgi:FAD/FMN-containing dehydrogenase
MWRRSRKQRARLVKLHGWSAAAVEGFAPPFSAADVKALQQRLVGEIVLPSDDAYAGARQLSNLAFQNFPLLIVYCEVFQDVHECLAFAQRHELRVTTRSGGHSTAGFSTNDGMVIDCSRMNSVVVDPRAKTATVGPGTNWEHLNATLADYQLHVPTGVCGDVCVAGFMQGGGYGLTSRKFGMNCDNVTEMLVMLADGRIARAAEDCNADLFWAMRGGTGNNFGVLLQATYRLHELPELWGYGLRWTLDQAPAAMAALQAGFMSGADAAPGDLGYMGAFVYETQPKGRAPVPVLIMRGVYWGSRKAGMKLLKPLIEKTGATLQLDKTGSYNELNDWLFETPEPVPNCPDLAREDKQSTLIARKLKVRDWQKVCELFRKSPNPWSCFAIEPYGGAINAVPRDATAFIHRNADMDFFVDVFWMNDEERREIEAWLDECMALLDGYGNGESYQNYPRLSQKDYRQRYWAEVFPALLAIKSKFDPDNFFHYAQSVSPEEGGKWPRPAKGDGIVAEAWGPKAIG